MRNRLWPLFLSMPLLWYSFFLFAPLSLVALVSLLSRSPYGTIEWSFTTLNYLQAHDLLYLKILADTIELAFLTTLLSFLIGFPCAWLISRAPPQARIWLILLITLPSLSSLLVRVYAIQILARTGSWVDNLTGIDLSSHPDLLVVFGMVTTYLPFMIVPLIVAIDRLDPFLLEACQDLGASLCRSLISVVLPSIRPAIVSGSTMVFIPSLGEYLIPDLLGGARSMLYGNLITEQFLKARNWPLGAAFAILLLTLLAVPQILSTLQTPRRRGSR